MGNIGPDAILPVLESKAVIMKNFAGVDALPIALKVDTVNQFVETLLNLSATFGAISLEDIASPNGIAISNQLEKAAYIPVVNNHRDGVSIGVLAGLINAAKVVGENLKEMRIIVHGAGTAGLGTAAILRTYGVREVIVSDRHGAIYQYRPHDMNWAKWEIAHHSNPHVEKGDWPNCSRGRMFLWAWPLAKTIFARKSKTWPRKPLSSPWRHRCNLRRVKRVKRGRWWWRRRILAIAISWMSQLFCQAYFVVC
ncbi:MAG: hypothetical protein M5U34_15555 [Chloroflexi bacterium]|nr:hypothetical protein [Chloroflexota bacterium]